jgi:hypothetical protein
VPPPTGLTHTRTLTAVLACHPQLPLDLPPACASSVNARRTDARRGFVQPVPGGLALIYFMGTIRSTVGSARSTSGDMYAGGPGGGAAKSIARSG